MHYWRHRPSGVGIHYDRFYQEDALITLPAGMPEPSKRPAGSWEIRLPSGALASFGWDAGMAEALEALKTMTRTVRSDEDKVYNSAIADVMDELDRMRRIGR